MSKELINHFSEDTDRFETTDKRLRSIEQSRWRGVGAIAAVLFILQVVAIPIIVGVLRVFH